MGVVKVKKGLFILFCFFCLTFEVYALEIDSKYAVLYNLNEHQVVYEEGKDERTSVASLTKIMTTITAIEKIEDYNQEVTIKSSMFTGLREQNAAVIGLRDGQKVTYNDLLYGMFLGSGADATRAVSISIAGSEEKFVELMNQKAQELNLSNTHFVNTVGLDDDLHYSTVNDIAKLLDYAFQNEKFKEIFTTKAYTLSDNSIKVSSTFFTTAEKAGVNSSYILGAKTGYTGNAGRCLASIAYDEVNQITYLLVTTNASITPHHVTDAVTIYDYFFNNYKYHTLVEKKEVLVKIPTKYSKQKEVKIASKKDITKYLSNDFSKEDVKIEYKGEEIITPSMKKGEKLGVVTIYYKDEIVDKVDILLPEKIEFSLLEFIIVHKIIILGIFVFLVLCFLLLIKLRKRNHNKKANANKRNK